MKNRICVSVLGMAALLLAAGCSPKSANADDGPGGATTQVVNPQFVDIGQVTPGAQDGNSGNNGNVEQPAPGRRGSEASLLQRIAQDLARRLAINSSEVMLVEIKAEVWEDAALGCPETGKTYAEGTVNGYRVTMRAQGRDYVYHTRGYDEFLRCDNGTPIAP